MLEKIKAYVSALTILSIYPLSLYGLVALLDGCQLQDWIVVAYVGLLIYARKDFWKNF